MTDISEVLRQMAQAGTPLGEAMDKLAGSSEVAYPDGMTDVFEIIRKLHSDYPEHFSDHIDINISLTYPMGWWPDLNLDGGPWDCFSSSMAGPSNLGDDLLYFSGGDLLRTVVDFRFSEKVRPIFEALKSGQLIADGESWRDNGWGKRAYIDREVWSDDWQLRRNGLNLYLDLVNHDADDQYSGWTKEARRLRLSSYCAPATTVHPSSISKLGKPVTARLHGERAKQVARAAATDVYTEGQQPNVTQAEKAVSDLLKAKGTPVGRPIIREVLNEEQFAIQRRPSGKQV